MTIYLKGNSLRYSFGSGKSCTRLCRLQSLENQPARNYFGMFNLGTSKNNVDVGSPSFELTGPVLEGGFWDDDEGIPRWFFRLVGERDSGEDER